MLPFLLGRGDAITSYDLIVISSEQRESSEPTKLFSFSQLA
jgi:hypothetical protein